MCDDEGDYIMPETFEFTFQPVTGRGDYKAQISRGTDISDAFSNIGRVIEGLNLNGVNLDRMTLVGHVVRNCTFDGASLRFLHCSHCLFEGVSFIRTDLSKEGTPNFGRSAFDHTRFEYVSASQANFCGAEFGNCVFKNTKFTECDFTGSVLQECDVLSDFFDYENDFSGSQFDFSRFLGVVLDHVNMQRTSWRNAIATSGNMLSQRREGSVLRFVDFRGGSFQNTEFRLARDTSRIDLRNTDARGLRLLAPDRPWPSDVIIEENDATKFSFLWHLIKRVRRRADLRGPWPAEGRNYRFMQELLAGWRSLPDRRRS